MPAVMNPVPTVPARWDWPSAIGSFILQCGVMEYFVNVFLTDHLPDGEFDKFKEKSLKDRLTEIERLLNCGKYSEEELVAFVDLIRRLEPMRELRNHLAHGHLYGRVNEETAEVTMGVLKARDLDSGYLEGTRHVEFPELLAALGTISSLLKEMENLAGFVTKHRFSISSEHSETAPDPPAGGVE